MRARILLLIAVVLVFGIGNVNAFGYWDIYHDTTINGDYGNIRIYDTPPDQTNVSMIGGDINGIITYDTSILTVTGGETEIFAHHESTVNIGGGTIYNLMSFETSVVDVYAGYVFILDACGGHSIIRENADLGMISADGTATVDMLGGETSRISAGDTAQANLYGGLVSDHLAAGDDGIINVYGYDLRKESTGGIFGDGYVSGEWENGTSFSIGFYGPQTYPRVILHEIPEPTIVFLLGFGSFLLRKRIRS